MTDTRNLAITDFTTLLLGVLGHTDGEYTALGYEDTACVFHTAVVAPGDAPCVVDQIPSTANTFFSVNTVRGPQRRNCGRGVETDVTRWTALWVDLDVEPGKCPSLDVARAIIANLSIILGTRPSVVVDSGHGLHSYWPITDGHITGGDIGAARALVKRWGRLVAVVAEKLHAHVDNVFELARMMRVPGTLNNKHLNGQGPLPVIAHADTGAPLTTAEVDERLAEVGILEEPGDRDDTTEVTSRPDKWQFGWRTCAYVAAILSGLPSDGPPENPKPGKGRGRHQWAASQAVKVTCALRLGCISETDWDTAQELLKRRLAELRAETGETVGRHEIGGLFKLAKQRTSCKTDEQCSAELGRHHCGKHPDPRDSSDTSSTADDGGVKHSGHLGMAVKLADQFSSTLLHVHGIGWHCWDSTRWAPDQDGAARRAVHTVINRDRRICEQLRLPPEEGERLRRQIAHYENAPAISGILTEAAVLTAFSITAHRVDADPWLLNCANGTLDLHALRLRPHDPADRITKICAGAYRPDAPTPVWDAFLARVLPDEAVRGFVQRLAGLGLLGEVREHVLPILTGVGANGKGTLYKALLHTLGDYAATAEPELFMHRDGAHPTGQMDLRGMRLVIVSESDEGRRLADATMKRLTGGDPIKARYMRENFVEFTPSHLAILVTNRMPKVPGDDPAIWRRIRVVPFDVVIPDVEQDKELDTKLQLEADGILSWAVAGWTDYFKHGLAEPGSVRVATDNYQRDNDAVGRFITEACVTSPVVKAITKNLYAAWCRWQETDGRAEPMGRGAFGEALDRRGYPAQQATHGKRWRVGIAVREDPNDE